MCSSCHTVRPVCPVPLQGGALCGAREADFKTDTDADVDSHGDSSSWLEEPFPQLFEKVARGEYEEVLSEVNRLKACLVLVEGRALRAMACKTSGGVKRHTLRRVQNVTRMSEELFFDMPRGEYLKCLRTLNECPSPTISEEGLEDRFPEEEFPIVIPPEVSQGRSWLDFDDLEPEVL